ncbi:DUF4124 domain-containing protein [Kaarinaea lacus]
MKKLGPLSFILILLILLVGSSAVFAGKIYRWVDSEGNVQYGEHPPAGQGKQMNIPSKTPSYAKPAAKPSTNADDTASKFLESVAAERKEKQEAADKAAKDKAIRDENCTKAKKHVASLKLGGRRFEVDEKGNRTYLDEAEIQKRLKEAEKDVEKWCK